LALKPAPTWKKEIHPFPGEQKWLVHHLTFDLLEGAKNMPKNMTSILGKASSKSFKPLVFH
jgi:hypothetical protein